MRIIKQKCINLPLTNWKSLDKNIVDEMRVYVTWNARSCVKILFFKNLLGMNKFWKKIGSHCGRGTFGVTNELGYDKCKFEKDGSEKWTRVVDINFFSIMGLCLDSLSVEQIMHECVHAAHSYQRRTIHSRKKWPGEKDMPEERICYASTRIACTIMRHLINKNITVPLLANENKKRRSKKKVKK